MENPVNFRSQLRQLPSQLAPSCSPHPCSAPAGSPGQMHALAIEIQRFQRLVYTNPCFLAERLIFGPNIQLAEILKIRFLLAGISSISILGSLKLPCLLAEFVLVSNLGLLKIPFFAD